jgi:hypothetical protein
VASGLGNPSAMAPSKPRAYVAEVEDVAEPGGKEAPRTARSAALLVNASGHQVISAVAAAAISLRVRSPSATEPR